MTIQLPKEVENSIIAKVHGGVFPSLDAAMTEAARLLLEKLEQSQGEMRNPPSDGELQRRLFAAGLLSEIRPSDRVATGTEEFTPVPIQGEPLSETVIRERR